MSKIFLLLFLVGLISTSGISQTVVLNPVKDNTIYSESGAESNGAGPELFVGQTGAHAGQARRRTLLQFNLASIPVGSVITGVSMTVNCTRVPPAGNAAPNLIKLHKTLTSWGEGTGVGGGGGNTATINDATWTCRFANGTGGCTQTWAAAGSDFSTTISSSVTVNGFGIYTFMSSPQLLADVQKWVDTPAVNFGWIMLGDEITEYSARGFHSRETSATAPALTITYSTAPCTANTWTGAVNSAWETAGNWSCGIVPDSTTNVMINSGTVILNSNRSVKSFTLSPGVNFKVNTGFNLTVAN